MSDANSSGADLLQQILRQAERSQREEAAYELLTAFHRGFSIENLRQVLTSPQSEVVEIGAWLASELGAKIRPLMSDVVPLLSREERGARFWAMDCVVVCPDTVCAEELLVAVRLVEDSDKAVRWKASTMLLVQMPRRLLQEALSVARNESEQGLIAGLDLLCNDSKPMKDIMEALRSESATLRRFALAAALRRGDPVERAELLSAASHSVDPELADWASEAARLQPLPQVT